jgi:hypothetical protein
LSFAAMLFLSSHILPKIALWSMRGVRLDSTIQVTYAEAESRSLEEWAGEVWSHRELCPRLNRCKRAPCVFICLAWCSLLVFLGYVLALFHADVVFY